MYAVLYLYTLTVSNNTLHIPPSQWTKVSKASKITFRICKQEKMESTEDSAQDFKSGLQDIKLILDPPSWILILHFQWQQRDYSSLPHQLGVKNYSWGMSKVDAMLYNNQTL